MQKWEKRVVEKEIQRSENEVHLWKEIRLCTLTPKLGVWYQVNMKGGLEKGDCGCCPCGSREKGWICDEHWKVGQISDTAGIFRLLSMPLVSMKNKYMSFISYVGQSSSHALCGCYVEVAAGSLCPRPWEESKSMELRTWFKWKARTIHTHGDVRAKGPFSNQPITLWNMEYRVASVWPRVLFVVQVAYLLHLCFPSMKGCHTCWASVK